MEPIDRRITAAQLMALRPDPNALAAIARVLGVPEMRPAHAAQTKDEIANFLTTGDATLAAQLIHLATLRKHAGAQPNA